MLKKIQSIAIVASVIASGASAEVSDICRSLLDGRAATFIVANGPGGGYDTYARAIAPIFGEESGLRVRVVNNEAGGGSVARRLTMNARANDLVILIENAVDLVVETIDAETDTAIIELLDTLGIIHVAPDAWILPEGLDISDTAVSNLVAAQGSLEDAVLAVILVGMALGIETSVVGGYGGSSDFVSAILRGEVDLTAISLQTAIRRTEGNEAYVALIVSAAMDPDAPETPYLGGEDGMAALRAEGLSEDIQAERRRFAEVAISLSGAIRGLYISRNVPQDVRDCLRDAIDVTLQSEALAEALDTQGRPLAPITGTAAAARTSAMIDAFRASRPLIERIMAEQGN
jgi:tripartite-type tricarboxylate transporter receptor subunit TctC